MCVLIAWIYNYFQNFTKFGLKSISQILPVANICETNFLNIDNEGKFKP